MTRKIPLGHLALSARAKQYVNQALDANRLSAGPFTERFEKEFADLHDCGHAVFMNSGTSALMTAIAALKIEHGLGDNVKVIVPAVTFVATANAAMHCGLEPLFVDVDPETFLIDTALAIQAAKGPDVEMAIPVHLFGLPYDAFDLTKHCLVVEDSCEAMFVSAHGTPVGSMGDFGCFSTYVSHVLTTGVGGLVTCEDAGQARLIRSLMHHGRDSRYLNIDAAKGKTLIGDFNNIVKARFLFPHQGWSFRATEMEAALGCAALEGKDAIMLQRSFIAHTYRKRLSIYADRIRLQKVPAGFDHANMLFPIVLWPHDKGRWFGGDRDRLMLELEDRGVETRTAMPLLNQPCIRELFGDIEKDYPVAHWMNQCGLCLPCHEGMVEEDVNYICDQIEDFMKEVL